MRQSIKSQWKKNKKKSLGYNTFWIYLFIYFYILFLLRLLRDLMWKILGNYVKKKVWYVDVNEQLGRANWEKFKEIKWTSHV